MAAFGLAALSFSPASSFAADGAQLAQKSGCMACHSMDKKVLGPAFKDVAAKYKGNADASALLAKKVKGGGGGAWGPIPMPAHAAVSDADIKTMVDWVLASN
ncbi:MAG: c-type cytochrome [Burkholderiaceae bacterium]|nr:c-type cytochrome [Burkholderiaceae bacterium]